MIEKLKGILTGDLGVSGYPIYEAISKYENSHIVELGTYIGESTQLFLLDAETKNNVVHTIDVSFDSIPREIKNNERLNMILGDSPTVGKYWDTPYDILFVDTFHIKEQVLSELYYWYAHIKEGGLLIFHDTNWPEDKHDEYGGILWDRPEEAIKDFFNIPSLEFEDEFIKSTNFPEKWGVTIIEVKKKKDYVKSYDNWSDVFKKRNHLISLFWNENNKGNVKIDLELDV
jgi:predicted O-methyltransferase YrrM